MRKVFIASGRDLLVGTRGGNGWRTEHHLAGAEVRCVTADPLQPGVLYCGTFDRGLWRSADGGDSWRHVEDFPGSAVMAVAVSPLEGWGGRSAVYVGTEPSALYRSDDGGRSWLASPGLTSLPSARTWSFPPRPETHHVRAIGVDRHTPGTLYVCIENGALVRSRDGGQTWEDRTPDSPRDTHTIATHERAPGRVYSAAGDGFVRPGHGFAQSTDGGDSWTYPDDGLTEHYGWGLAVDPGDPDTVLISVAPGPQEAHNPRAARSGVYRRTRGGPWQEVQDGLPGREGMLANVLACNPAESGVFYAVSNQGLYRSADGGRSWAREDLEWPPHYRFAHVQDLTVLSA